MTYKHDGTETTAQMHDEQHNGYSFTKRRRLHPAAIIFRFTLALKETVFGLGIGFIVTMKESFIAFLLFGGAFILFLIGYSMLSWWRFTYYVYEDELRIEQGVFIRKKRFISFHRIHKIDMTANLIHRLFKLTNMQIDTASSSGGAEVALSAVKVTDATALRNVIQKGKSSTDSKEKSSTENKEEGTILSTKKVTWKNLFIAGSTSGSIGFMILAVLAFGPQLEQVIPTSALNKTFQFVVTLSIIFLVVAICLLLVGLWVLGIAGTMIKYGNFTIEKREKELFIKRGLIETKELTIPFDRIQAIGLEQSLIRQPLGYVKVYAVVAGGSFDRTEAFPVLFPLIHKKEVTQFLQTFMEDHVIELQQDAIRLPNRSRKYFIVKQLIFPMIIFSGLLYFFPSFAWIPALLAVLLGWYGYMGYKDVRVQTEGKSLTFQIRRLFDRVTVMTYKRRIQSLKLTAHPWQKKDGLMSAHLSLIGSSGLGTHYTVSHMEIEDAMELAEWFSYQQSVVSEERQIEGDMLCEE